MIYCSKCKGIFCACGIQYTATDNSSDFNVGQHPYFKVGYEKGKQEMFSYGSDQIIRLREALKRNCGFSDEFLDKIQSGEYARECKEMDEL